MFRMLPFLLFICVGLFRAQPAEAASCDFERPAPEVAFEEFHQKTRLDHSRSSSEIAAIASEHRHQNNYKNHKVRGFTFYRLSAGLELTFSGKIFKNKLHCLYVKSAKFKTGFKKMDVFIDRKYPRGSCAYTAILDHENIHVAINNAALGEFLPTLRPALRKAVMRMPVHRSYNTKTTTHKMRDALMAPMNRMIDDFSEQLKKKHARIDTIESYRQVRDKCRDW